MVGGSERERGVIQINLYTMRNEISRTELNYLQISFHDYNTIQYNTILCNAMTSFALFVSLEMT